MHLYRRFRPDFTGDGIYYEQLIPLLTRFGSSHTVLVCETAAPCDPVHVGDRAAIYLQSRSPWKLAGWIFRHRRDFDILHIHTHVDRIFLSYLMARLQGWKVIYSSTLSDTVAELVSTYRWANRPIARLFFSAIDVFVGISPRLLSPGLPDRRRRLIPQGVRLPVPTTQEERARLRQRLGMGPEESILLYLGSISERKGIHELVECFCAIHAQRPQTRLLLVGPVLEPQYWQAIRDRCPPEIVAKITHIPFDPSPSAYYCAADLFVFASRDEGFGNVLLEAMSHGLPVISRYLDGVTEVFIEHGRTGFLFSSAAALQEQVLALVDQPLLGRRIGEAARAHVETHYALEDIAGRYAELYRELHAGSAASRIIPPPAAAPALEMRFRQVRAPDARPTLLVVVDTESEFDWSKGVTADQGAVHSIERLPLVQGICERYDVSPCYVVDYPVATNPASAAVMRAMAARGAEIGAHLQPWTTPPFVEPVDNAHAFPGNLPLWLQKQKLSQLVQAMRDNLGIVPRVFKAGRYGIGGQTLEMLEDMGFEVDLSIAPGFDYSRQAGPDFSGFDARLSWFGRSRDLLEIPTTSAFMGPLRWLGPGLWRTLDRRWARTLKLQGVLARTGLLSRARLSPEGYRLATMKKLTRDMLATGARHLTLSFHSSSLRPGFTPYCASPADVESLLQRLDSYLRFFRKELGGETSTPGALHRQLTARRRP